MKTIHSAERTTGMGATRYSAVLVDGNWIKVSDYPGRLYLGRDRGEENYKAQVPDNATTARFYRSNSGKEEVDVDDGPTLYSFQAADRWGLEQANKLQEQHCCPTCGQSLAE